MVILYLPDLSFVAYYYIQKLKTIFFICFVLFLCSVMVWFCPVYVLTLYVWCYLYNLMQFKYVNDTLPKSAQNCLTASVQNY